MVENKDLKKTLQELVKKSEYDGVDKDFIDKPLYKEIDSIYNNDPKKVVDILYDIVFDNNLMLPDDNGLNRANAYGIICWLLLQHKRDGDDVDYIKSKYYEIIKTIVTDNRYNINRHYIDSYLYGLEYSKIIDLFRECLKTEKDPKNIDHFKWIVLSNDIRKRFPEKEQKIMFIWTTSTLELSGHRPYEESARHAQENINGAVRRFGEELVKKFLKVYYNHDCVQKRSKNILKEIKVNGEVMQYV